MGFKTSCIVSFSMFVMVLLISGCWRSFGEDLEVACEGNQTCASGLECSINGSCVCSSNSCSGCCSPDGLVCHDGQQDNACGPPGGTCQICGDTQMCIDSRCVDPTPTCLNQGGCESAGEAICAQEGHSYFLCEENDEGCFEPGAHVACGEHQVCEGQGECVCENLCHEPSVRCSGLSYVECQFDKGSGCWVKYEGVCADGQACNDSGGEICANICEVSGCEPSMEGEHQCLDEHTLGTCGYDKINACWTWASDYHVCGFEQSGFYYCSHDVCEECPVTSDVSEPCSASEEYDRRCSLDNLNIVEVCEADLDHPGCYFWVPHEPCAEMSFCFDETARCVECPVDCEVGDNFCDPYSLTAYYECEYDEHGCPDWQEHGCPELTPRCLYGWDGVECSEVCPEECGEEEIGFCRANDSTGDTFFCEEITLGETTCWNWEIGHCRLDTVCHMEHCRPLVCASHEGPRGMIASGCSLIEVKGISTGICTDVDGERAFYTCDAYSHEGEECYVLVFEEICEGSWDVCRDEFGCQHIPGGL